MLPPEPPELHNLERFHKATARIVWLVCGCVIMAGLFFIIGYWIFA